ncbi:phage integrase SAM-like domain-containing protein [Niabella ginsenosidivorans]|uniref:phage integrase SAM-like domain-containing protein n=1 Tax=Niabella ginsenosidivorans TaxID=1176587 RepID=UPI0012ED8904
MTNNVNNHKKKNNRHLPTSFKHFKTFLGKDYISPTEITEDLCKRFRTYLLERFTGLTPMDY